MCIYRQPFYLKKGDLADHMQKLETTLDKLKEIGSKCNIEKSFFGKPKIEYLCFW